MVHVHILHYVFNFWTFFIFLIYFVLEKYIFFPFPVAGVWQQFCEEAADDI